MSAENGTCQDCAEKLRASVAIAPYGREREVNVPVGMTSGEVVANMLEVSDGISDNQPSMEFEEPQDPTRYQLSSAYLTRAAMPAPLAQLLRPRRATHIMLVPGGNDIAGHGIVQIQKKGDAKPVLVGDYFPDNNDEDKADQDFKRDANGFVKEDQKYKDANKAITEKRTKDDTGQECKCEEISVSWKATSLKCKSVIRGVAEAPVFAKPGAKVDRDNQVKITQSIYDVYTYEASVHWTANCTKSFQPRDCAKDWKDEGDVSFTIAVKKLIDTKTGEIVVPKNTMWGATQDKELAKNFPESKGKKGNCQASPPKDHKMPEGGFTEAL